MFRLFGSRAPASAPNVTPMEEVDDDLLCPICAEPFNFPMSLVCGHTFCKLCLMELVHQEMEAKKDTACPLCRTQFRLDGRGPQRRDEAVVRKMQRVFVKCPGCKRTLRLDQAKEHFMQCQPYQNEEQTLEQELADDVRTNYTPPLSPVIDDGPSVDEFYADEAPAREQRGYDCPVCGLGGLDWSALNDHIRATHNDGRSYRGVCPICASQPGGDPNYMLSNVVQHFLRYHGFSGNDFFGGGGQENYDEEAILRMVLEASMRDM